MAPNPVIYVSFQNNTTVFFPGLPISGHVEVSSIEGVTCKAISVQLKGSANVHFSKQESYRDSENKHKTRTKHYRSSENYYIINMKVWDNNSVGGLNEQLLPGTHKFPFSFMIPMSTPSSFESKIGNVRHICKATIERSIFKRNFRCTMPFSVVSICDLNMMPFALNPILASDDKTLCCLCCASGPLSVLLNVGRTGYVPGENIIINAECSNKSNRVVNYTEVTLIQKRMYKAQGRTETEYKTICSKRNGPIPAGGDYIWSGELLPIPPVVPSGLNGCDIIDIQYILQFIMSPSGASTDLKLKEAIVIGTIPLRTHFNQFVPANVVPVSLPVQNTQIPIPPSAPPAFADNPPPYNQLEAPSVPPHGFPGLDLYPDMPPPTYSECAFGLQNLEYDTSDDEQTGDNKSDPKQFAPQYISYNLGINAPASSTDYGWLSNQAPSVPERDYPMSAHLIQDA